MTSKAQSYRDRIEQYERRVHMCTWMGASLAGFIALIAVNAIPESPTALKPIVFTLIAVAATSAAYTRVGFEWEATKLKREIESQKLPVTTVLPAQYDEWPRTERWWSLFLYSYAFAGVFLLISIWWHPAIQIASNMSQQGVATSPTIEDLDRKFSVLISELSCQVEILAGSQSSVAKSEAIEREKLLVTVDSVRQEMERVSHRIEHLDIKINNLSDIFCKCNARK